MARPRSRPDSHPGRPLVWFRRDLRVQDHPALFEACDHAADGVVAVFAITPGQWRKHDDSAWKVDLLRRSLEELSGDLEERGIPLKIVREEEFSDLPKTLLDFAKSEGCTALYFNEEHEVYEKRRDKAVRKVFEDAGMPIHTFLDQILVDPESLRTGTGEPYKTYTPFRRAWLQHVVAHGLPRLYGEPPAVKKLDVPADGVPSSVDGFDAPDDAADLWPAGETTATKRLRSFCDGPIQDYKKDRDFPGRDGTSTLSPYLALGLVSPRRCIEAARKANKGHLSSGRVGPDTWISELLWREFYRHIVVNYPRVSMSRAFLADKEGIAWRDDEAGFEAWCEGRTGFPIVDAAMRQLREAGWMHNRLRMIAAMFLTKDLLIDWRRGEAFFMKSLVDGDLANNNGGWQWSASTGTDAAPYFRIFNPITQGVKFDPDGSFVRAHVAELEGIEGDAVHDPDPETRERCGYPMPIVDHKEARERVMTVFQNQ